MIISSSLAFGHLFQDHKFDMQSEILRAIVLNIGKNHNANHSSRVKVFSLKFWSYSAGKKNAIKRENSNLTKKNVRF